jgi:hypothetical protein
VHPTKLRARDGEDLDGMTIALDSKRQELELVRSSFSLCLIVWDVLIGFAFGFGRDS